MTLLCARLTKIIVLIQLEHFQRCSSTDAGSLSQMCQGALAVALNRRWAHHGHLNQCRRRVVSLHSPLVCGMRLTSTAVPPWALSKVLTPTVWLLLSVQWWAAVTGLRRQAELSKAYGRKTGPLLLFISALCPGVKRKGKNMIDEHLLGGIQWVKEDKAFRFTAEQKRMFFFPLLLSSCFLIFVTVHHRQRLHWLGWFIRSGRWGLFWWSKTVAVKSEHLFKAVCVRTAINKSLCWMWSMQFNLRRLI